MTTKQTGHTPGPWTLSDNPVWSHCIYSKDGCVAQGNAPYSSSENSELAKANATFIVTACNSHYELLEALKLATVYECDDHCVEIYPVACIHSKIRQAISKAQGETQ